MSTATSTSYSDSRKEGHTSLRRHLGAPLLRTISKDLNIGWRSSNNNISEKTSSPKRDDAQSSPSVRSYIPKHAARDALRTTSPRTMTTTRTTTKDTDVPTESDIDISSRRKDSVAPSARSDKETPLSPASYSSPRPQAQPGKLSYIGLVPDHNLDSWSEDWEKAFERRDSSSSCSSSSFSWTSSSRRTNSDASSSRRTNSDASSFSIDICPAAPVAHHQNLHPRNWYFSHKNKIPERVRGRCGRLVSPAVSRRGSETLVVGGVLEDDGEENGGDMGVLKEVDEEEEGKLSCGEDSSGESGGSEGGDDDVEVVVQNVVAGGKGDVTKRWGKVFGATGYAGGRDGVVREIS